MTITQTCPCGAEVEFDYWDQHAGVKPFPNCCLLVELFP